MVDADVCVVGSGAGGAPVAWSLARRGYDVVVLEKGPWRHDADFAKDELAIRRGAFVPRPDDEPQVVELADAQGRFAAWPAAEVGWSFWNGSMVGGATNLMSGFFHRMKPIDFRLLSEFGPIEGGQVADWPITYDTLEPWYAAVEAAVGVSGRVTDHPFSDRRSTPDFPLPPLATHPLAEWVDAAAARLGLHSFAIPRAVLSAPRGERSACNYSGYCGGYGCTTGAKGSARAAFLEPAVATGRCRVVTGAQAHRLALRASGAIDHVVYSVGAEERRLSARVYVVACQAIESARLLLASAGPGHPAGLGNRSGLVGRNLLFSASGHAMADFPYDDYAPAQQQALRSAAPFLDRAIQDDYVLQSPRRAKGGTIDFLLPHPNPIAAATALAAGPDGPVWGVDLKRRLQQYFGRSRHVKAEIFADWVPNADCRVTLDPAVRDRWQQPVARVRVTSHPENARVAEALIERAGAVLEAMGGRAVRGGGAGGASTNLVAGTCRFGTDPERSVLDPDCRAHDAPNLFVTDGSFMPTAGSTPFTFTIYANALRVAEVIAGQLGGARADAHDLPAPSAPAGAHKGAPWSPR